MLGNTTDFIVNLFLNPAERAELGWGDCLAVAVMAALFYRLQLRLGEESLPISAFNFAKPP